MSCGVISRLAENYNEGTEDHAVICWRLDASPIISVFGAVICFKHAVKILVDAFYGPLFAPQLKPHRALTLKYGAEGHR